MKNNLVKTIAATVIGAVLFFVLGRFISVPLGISGTYISLQYGLLAFISAIYGPIAGMLTGLIGHFFIDFKGSIPDVCWSWVIASSFFGCMTGFMTRKYTLADGEFSKHDASGFNISQALAHLLAWVLIAPVLDIVLNSEPVKKVFLQGLAVAGVNIVTTCVVGTLLLFVYAAFKPKKGSLKNKKDF